MIAKPPAANVAAPVLPPALASPEPIPVQADVAPPLPVAAPAEQSSLASFMEIFDSFSGPDQPLTVLALDVDAQPVAAATVEVWPTRDARSGEPQRFVTDEHGQCHVPLAPGAGVVFASKEGVGTSGLLRVSSFDDVSEAGMHLPEDASPELVMAHMQQGKTLTLELKAQGRLHGTVRSETGAPVAGAELIIDLGDIPEMHKGTLPRVPQGLRTDADGRFDVMVDAPLIADIHAVLGDRSTQTAFMVLGIGDADEEDLRFPGGFRVEGQVHVPDGTKPAGVRIVAVRLGDEQYPGVTDEQGRFRLAVSTPGELTLFAESPGLIEAAPLGCSVTDAAPVAQVELTLLPPTTISGRVARANGEAVTYFGVSVCPEDPATGRSLSYEWRPDGGSLMDQGVRLKDGRFEVGPLSPERSFRVSVSGEGRAELRHVRGGTRGLEVVLPPSSESEATIRGRVVDATTGQPVPRVEITIPGSGYGNGWSDQADGLFELEDLSTRREWAITFKAPGYADFTTEPIWLGPEGAELTVRMGTPGGVRVHVVTAAGAPVADALVDVLPVGRLGLYYGDHASHGTTDASGVASLSDLPPGDAWLIVASGESRGGPRRITIPSGGLTDETVAMRQAAPAILDVTVLHDAPEDIADIEATLKASGLVADDLRATTVDTLPVLRDGTVRFVGVSPGLYAVTLQRAGDEVAWRRIIVESGAQATLTLFVDG